MPEKPLMYIGWGRWGELARRASRPLPFCQKLTIQWSRAFVLPIPLLEPNTTSGQIRFFSPERKLIYKKLIFDDSLDFEKFSSSSVFVVVVKH